MERIVQHMQDEKIYRYNICRWDRYVFDTIFI